MKRLIIPTIALAMIPSVVAAQSTSIVSQWGMGNAQTTAQNGRNFAATFQGGKNNTAAIAQSGGFNAAAIIQRGSGHEAAINQEGKWRGETVVQVTTRGGPKVLRKVETGNETMSVKLTFESGPEETEEPEE